MKMLDCRLVTRESFFTERGYQPKNSFFCILEGEFSYTANGESARAGRGDVILFSDRVYFERRILSPMTFYYARFSLSEGEKPYGEIVCAKYGERILEDFVMMERLSRLPGAVGGLADHYLTDVLATLNAARFTDVETGDPTVAEALSYLRAHLSEQIALCDVAEACGVSVSSLSMKFRRQLGCSPIATVNAMRIERAKELLSESGLRIAEIGAQCGFEDPYYFSNAFLKHVGVRPKEYRRQIRI